MGDTRLMKRKRKFQSLEEWQASLDEAIRRSVLFTWHEQPKKGRKWAFRVSRTQPIYFGPGAPYAIFDVAGWGRALTKAELAKLRARVSPSLLRRGTFYMPLYQAKIGGADVSHLW
jgi:hypothetical protein